MLKFFVAKVGEWRRRNQDHQRRQCAAARNANPAPDSVIDRKGRHRPGRRDRRRHHLISAHHSRDAQAG